VHAGYIFITFKLMFYWTRFWSKDFW